MYDKVYFMYAIIDIETTGGSPKRDKITEIAIFIHNGTEILDEFTTLVNPEKLIPPYITQLTGITNEMVEGAPKFYEVAKRIVELTENNIFVAHNVNFDYRFIQSEFERLGYAFSRKKICTVKLSRKLVPSRRSYSLGNVCRDLGISIEGRHRAAGDALATVKLLEILIGINGEAPETDNILLPSVLASINPALDPNFIRNLPGQVGVYYFINDENDIVYIGKSKNIHERVLSHFHNNRSKRAIEMKNQITDISYELTGSELVALLLESREIKKFKPKYNRAQRRTANSWGIYTSNDENGYLNIRIDKNLVKNGLPVMSFKSQVVAKEKLYKLIDQYNLCQKLCGLYDSPSACFHYQIGECNGACNGEEPAEVYNKRVINALKEYKLNKKNILIIDKGRQADEKSVIKVEHGKYIGYGYVDFNTISNDITELHDCITQYDDNQDIQTIIRKYLSNNRVESIINF